MNKHLEQYISLCEFFAKTIAPNYEIILFDTTKVQIPVVCRFNNINGTEESTRTLLKEALKSEVVVATGKTVNRVTASEFKKMIKTSIFLIKDEMDKVQGALCINVNTQTYFELENVISKMLRFNTAEINEPDAFLEEIESQGQPPTLETIDRVVADFGVDPTRLDTSERMELICDLMDEGVFEIKGAVARTAKLLNVSEKTIYRYISDIRKVRS